MKNVDTSLGEAPSIAERLRWGGSHGTALYFLLTVSTFPRHRCGGRCSSCRGQRMPLSLRDCRSAHHQNILSCAGMLSCTFPEIQHCSLHQNPVKRIRSSPFASSFNSSIKESVSLEPADVKSWTHFHK